MVPSSFKILRPTLMSCLLSLKGHMKCESHLEYVGSLCGSSPTQDFAQPCPLFTEPSAPTPASSILIIGIKRSKILAKAESPQVQARVLLFSCPAQLLRNGLGEKRDTTGEEKPV